MTKLEKLVIGIAKDLLAKGSTTTLDIKLECRKKYPGTMFYQSDISDIMMQIAPSTINNLSWTDTGSHRVYQTANTSITTTQAPQHSLISKVSKSEAVAVLKLNTGKFFGITFEKKNGDQRTLNGQMRKDKFMNDLGYLNVITNKGEHKLVDPKKIKSITMGKKTFVVK